MRVKLFIFLTIVVVGVIDCFSETVSRKEAENVAKYFFEALNRETMPVPDLVYNGRNLTTDRLFPPFYVFNSSAGGFVVISAENKAYPILAYDRYGKFDINELDEASSSFLKKFAREIEFIRYDSRIPTDAILSWTDLENSIEDLLKKQFVGNGRFFRNSAIEFSDLLADNYDNSENTLDSGQEPPFSFYNQIVEETKSSLSSWTGQIEDSMINESPIIKSLGGGHYEVIIPENLTMGRIYNLQGSQIDALKFNGTNVAHIKLDGMPNGFYFLLLNGKSGKSYGFKLLK